MMSKGVLDLCNRALSLIGADRIESMEEASAEAKNCNLHYEAVRDEILREAEWNFAMKSEPLALLGELQGGSYEYQRPSHCVFVSQVYGPEGPRPVRANFRIMGDRIICAIRQAQADYIRSDFLIEQADSLFQTAMEYRLASKMSATLGDANPSEKLMQYYMEYIARARLANAQEREQEVYHANPYSDER